MRRGYGQNPTKAGREVCLNSVIALYLLKEIERRKKRICKAEHALWLIILTKVNGKRKIDKCNSGKKILRRGF